MDPGVTFWELNREKIAKDSIFKDKWPKCDPFLGDKDTFLGFARGHSPFDLGSASGGRFAFTPDSVSDGV